MFNWILIDSGQKLLLYGKRIRINYSWSWKCWKLKSSTLSIILEILEIWFFDILISWKYWKLDFSIFSYPGNIGNRVFLIAWYPGNIGNWIFLVFWYPRNIGNWSFLIFWSPGNIGYWSFLIFWSPGNIGYWILLFSHILEIRAAGGRRRAGGSRGCVVLPWIIFGTCFLEFPDILEILEIWFLLIFGIFTKKTRAEISRRMVRFSRRDLSYETDSGPKTKTVSDPNFQVTGWNTSSCSRPAAWRHA